MEPFMELPAQEHRRNSAIRRNAAAGSPRRGCVGTNLASPHAKSASQLQDDERRAIRVLFRWRARTHANTHGHVRSAQAPRCALRVAAQTLWWPPAEGSANRNESGSLLEDGRDLLTRAPAPCCLERGADVDATRGRVASKRSTHCSTKSLPGPRSATRRRNKRRTRHASIPPSGRSPTCRSASSPNASPPW
jgi:hypothetical protein